MTLRVYNTLTGKKEEFVPLNKGEVKMYVCGITAYDHCHLGHARAAVAFDIVFRFLQMAGYKTTYVRNYTDVDDKIIKRAEEQKTTAKELAEKYIKEYQEDMKSLQVLPATIEPKATAHIPQMIAMIQSLVKNGLAYEAEGNVYFSVRKFPKYGKLTHKNVDELEAGSRIEIDETKKDPLDFALWKRAKPGEPEWDSPWGKGRPGWHIECSTMSTKYLGETFDIHGGGRDLVFPHHENEIAQSEGASGRPFARYWLHNGFININAEKMSKSLGNFKTIKQVLSEYDWEVVRYFLISSHYRSPLDYTESNLRDAKAALDRFYEMMEKLETVTPSPSDVPPPLIPPPSRGRGRGEGELDKKKTILKMMEEDFNTAGAFGKIFEWVRETNGLSDIKKLAVAAAEWKELQLWFGDLFGVFYSSASDYKNRIRKIYLAKDKLDTAQIEVLLQERKVAREKKDFGRADAIRKELLENGVEIKDHPDGSTEWYVR